MSGTDWPERVAAELAPLRRKHFVLDEDCWYTCPAATDERDGGHSCNDQPKGVCTCNADAYNAKLDEIAARIGRGFEAALNELPRHLMLYQGGAYYANRCVCSPGEVLHVTSAEHREAAAARAFEETTI